MTAIDPIHYTIRLEPNLEAFTFTGSAEISVLADHPVEEITLDMLGLAVRSCRLKEAGGFVDCPFCVDPKKEKLKIFLSGETKGELVLKLEYTGSITDKLAGFYRSRYGREEAWKYIAVTQFEESDARRAFPCFDHPVKKATFDIEMIVDQDLQAVSNTPVMEEKVLGEGRKRVTFERTPRMSTYLVFLGVGDFEFLSDSKGVLIRVVTIPGMTKYAGFGLEFARKSLDYCEEYYGVKYPLAKLDLLAIPDFAAGAMENWGAITFRENLLLNFPGITSKAGEERICEVIAHEIAHQWFGNLVTPSDWKYLWLNESFATYFAYGVVDHYHPEWNMWDLFLHGMTDSALRRDALHETCPIEIPGGEHVVINASTAPIIYNKGASNLRQIKGYIGETHLREGLRSYLKKHEYGCAASHHLWEALEEVSKMPVTEMMKSWVEQPGYPVVEVKKREEELVFSQKRFTYLPNRSGQTWLIPIRVRVFYGNGESASKTLLHHGPEAVLHVGPDAVACKVNEGQSGFYRVKYLDWELLQELGKRVSRREMGSEDRWGLQNDLYAWVMAGEVSVDDYLEFLAFYKREEAFLPLISIADNLHHAYLVLGASDRAKVASRGRSLMKMALANLGYEPVPGEKHSVSVLRDHLFLPAVLFGSEKTRAFTLDAFDSMRKGAAIHPDIMRSVMQIGAYYGKGETFEWFDLRLKTAESEHERMNVLTALGCFRERGLIEKVQEYALKDVPGRNKFVPIVSLASNPDAVPLMWDWFVSHLEEIEQLHPIHYERIIGAIVPMAGLGREKEMETFFEAYSRSKDLARDVIKLSLEKLAIHSRMRERGLSLKRDA
jgi:aminopeptidase N